MWFLKSYKTDWEMKMPVNFLNFHASENIDKLSTFSLGKEITYPLRG